jgi:hypothetical protein
LSIYFIRGEKTLKWWFAYVAVAGICGLAATTVDKGINLLLSPLSQKINKQKEVRQTKKMVQSLSEGEFEFLISFFISKGEQRAWLNKREQIVISLRDRGIIQHYPNPLNSIHLRRKVKAEDEIELFGITDETYDYLNKLNDLSRAEFQKW